MFGLFSSKKSEDTTIPVKFLNTESGEKEVFEPLTKGKVKMYSCGPTVYDYVHIGNLRSFLMADLIKRVLIFNDYDVKHTMNFTDFGHLTDDGDAGEDKMMKGLKREGLPITLAAMRQLSDTYITAFKKDIEALNIIEPTTYSRASDYLQDQINLIKTLEQKGYTYETSDGLYFDISKFPTYGRLGKIDLDKIRDGARVEINKEKRHQADFAVWKKGLLGWESKWEKGFPGWHIECSAMAMATLGKQIDIHTGGEDLVHPHHNAEIAQSESATGKRFVHYWMHNAFITIDNTKIAKSLGNSITMRHLHDQGFSGEDYRYWLLQAHYRSPANFSFEALKAAKQALFRLKRHVYEEYGNVYTEADAGYIERFTAAINDDIDTPKALALMWEVTKDDSLSREVKSSTLKDMDGVLGLGLNEATDDAVRELGVVAPEELPEEIQTLLDEREAARIAHNWDRADAIREELNFKGYSLEDTPHGAKVTKN
ncbi:MAG: cysteine--tRNA ligase [Patescibacteria group bacterium]